jgi:RNA polymerase sigma factor CnrH
MTLAMSNDAALVAATLAGDESAFTALVTRHKKWLYRYIRRYVHEEAEAHDVLQESLIAAWRGLKSYDSNRSLDIWLRRIALNKCRDRARRLAVRRIILPWSARSESVTADPTPIAEESLAESERENQLRVAIDALPGHLRDALILTAIEGLSHAKAAEILLVTPKAVEGAVYRAKKQLATSLRHDPPQATVKSAIKRLVKTESVFRPIDSIIW